MSAGYDHCVCIDSEGCVWSWGATGHPPRKIRRLGLGIDPQEGAEVGTAAPALMAARLVGGGQLGRRVDAAADALEPLPAARADLIGCRVAHVAAGGLFEIQMAPLPFVKAAAQSPARLTWGAGGAPPLSSPSSTTQGAAMPPASYLCPPRRLLSALDQ